MSFFKLFPHHACAITPGCRNHNKGGQKINDSDRKTFHTLVLSPCINCNILLQVYHNGTLIIQMVSNADKGSYTCIASNAYGRTDVWKTNLVIVGKSLSLSLIILPSLFGYLNEWVPISIFTSNQMLLGCPFRPLRL